MCLSYRVDLLFAIEISRSATESTLPALAQQDNPSKDSADRTAGIIRADQRDGPYILHAATSWPRRRQRRPRQR